MYGQANSQQLAGVSLFLVVIIFIFAYLMLTFYNPEYVQRKVHGHRTGENDVALTMIWALVITLVIVFLLALLAYALTCWH